MAAADKKTDVENLYLYENKKGRWKQFWHEIADLKILGSLSDVTLKIGQRQWAVHKIVLVTMSPYFKAIFTHDTKEKNQSVVELHGLDADCVEHLINYAYTGIIRITETSVQGLLNAADMWHLEEVKDVCCQFMAANLHPLNCLAIISFAEAHSCSELLENSRSFAVKHFVEVVQTEDFLNLSFEQIIELVEGKSIRINATEDDIYNAIMLWIKHDFKNRQRYLPQLLKIVSFEMLPTKSFEEIKNKEQLFHSCKEFKEAILEALFKRISPSQNEGKPVNSFVFVSTHGNAECFLYDTRRRLPAKTPPMLDGKRRFHSIATVDDKLYAIGGQIDRKLVTSCERFDPLERHWSPMAPLATERQSFAACSLDGLIYVSGGCNERGSVSSKVECFNPSTNSWTGCGSMQKSRSEHAMLALGEYLYVIGGYDGSKYLKANERYSIKSKCWEVIEDMNECRGSASAVTHDGKLYVAGGTSDRWLSSVECYDPGAHKWQNVANMSHERRSFGLVEIGGRLYAIGGYNDPTIDCYDPVENTWTIHGEVSQFGFDTRAVSFNCDKIFEERLYFS